MKPAHPRTQNVRRRGRSILSTVLVVLAVLGLVASTAAFWTRTVVYEEDRWIETVRDLPRQHEVAVALADYLTEELFLAVDFERRISDALPEDVAVIVPILTNAIRGFVEDQTAAFIESQPFERLWVAANREAHRLLVALLDDRGVIPGLERTDDTVTLDLIPALSALLDQIGDVAGSVVDTDISVPEITDDESTADAIRALSERLGVDLPEDFAQITVYRGDQLPQPRDTVVLIERLRFLTAVATVALAVLAIVIAPNRRRAIVGLLLGSAIGFGVLLLVPGSLAHEVGRLIADDQDRDAARSAMGVVFASYLSLYRWLLVVALFSAAMIVVTGPSRIAGRVRSEVRRRVERLSWSADAARLLRRRVMLLRMGGPVVGAVVVVLLTRRSLTAWFVLFALVATWESLLSLVPARDREAAGQE